MVLLKLPENVFLEEAIIGINITFIKSMDYYFVYDLLVVHNHTFEIYKFRKNLDINEPSKALALERNGTEIMYPGL